MTQKKIACLVLAAGQSKRMKSDTSKIFHEISGRTIIGHVLTTLEQLSLNQIVIIASPNVPIHSEYRKHTVTIQEHQLGTGHAVLTAFPAVHNDIDDVLIVCGDTPLLTADTLNDLIWNDANFALLKSELPQNLINAPYGRIIFHNHKPIQIIEYKDAPVEIQQSLHMNPGVYKIKKSLLETLLPQLTKDNAAGEYYLTDLLRLAVAQGASTHAIQADFNEVLGINTREDLANADAVIQQRLRTQMMANGVTLLSPETIRLSIDTVIGQDTIIEPFVHIKKGVVLDDHVTIKSYSYLENCYLKKNTSVGPHAHIRGHSIMEEGSEIGNFVELKAAHLGKKTKAKHLTYLGDAIIGAATNIGAGTITANYDGFFKHKTMIGDNVHVGVDTIMIAPVTIGTNAMTGAGSIITQDVPQDALAVSRVRQQNMSNWARTYKEKMHKKKYGED